MKTKTLSNYREKVHHRYGIKYVYPEEKVKDEIKKTQEELKEKRFSIETRTKKCQGVIRVEEIDKIFKKRFGELE